LQKFLYIFIFLSQVIFSQTETIEISGKVSDPRDEKEAVFCCKVRLSFDSLFIETECDTTGHYSFTISKSLMRNHKTSLYAYQDHRLRQKKYPAPADCPYLYFGPKRYMNSITSYFEYKPNIGIYKTDVEMQEGCFLQRGPCFNFKKNSVELVKCEDFDPDTSLFCLKNTLLKNPTIIIEINAHAYDEENNLKISELRAKEIKNKMVAFGIDSLRIAAKGHGDAKPLMAKYVLQKAKTKEEKELLKAMNRRAYFSILSWDYDPVLKKIISR
jgi:outer membrane protein OmpA-like peptidoglycan-associated protein